MRQSAVAHAVDHGGYLRRWEVVDPSELVGGHAHVEGEQDVRLEAADTLGHQGDDVAVATTLVSERDGVKQLDDDATLMA